MKKGITKSIKIILLIIALIALITTAMIAMISAGLMESKQNSKGDDVVAFVDLPGKVIGVENDENDESKSQNNSSIDKESVMSSLVGSEEERKIIESIGEYVVCSKVYKKEFDENRGMYLSDELKEALNKRNLIDNILECPYDCDEYYENGECIHTEEIVNSGEWEPAVKIEYDQNEMIPWRGGTIAVSEAKAGIVSFNMYDITGGDDSDILYVVKMVCDDAGDTINARAVYDIYKGNIVEVRY